MSDDTTTWLKKNPAINPLRRSLKTSLRFHVPNADMDASIISNPDRVKNQELFIPRMLQRPKTQMRMSKAHQFKVPELVVNKPGKKKENISGSSIKSKKSPGFPRKSCLPVPKSKGNEREMTRGNLIRPSLLPGGSRRGSEARREIIQKMMELSDVKKSGGNTSNQLSVTSSDNSVLRSILKKKRASLRRSMQMSGSKPKAKKVLFDGFQNSEEKENMTLSPMEHKIQNVENDFAALDEPTVFFKFPQNTATSSEEIDGSFMAAETSTTITDISNVNNLLKYWNSYKEVNNLQSAQKSLENSIECLLQHTLTVQKEYNSFKKNTQEIFANLERLGEELEKNFKKVLEGNHFEETETPKAKRRSAGKKLLEKDEKIRLSDKSKAIKKGSGKKAVGTIKNGLLKDTEDSFSFVYKKSFVGN